MTSFWNTTNSWSSLFGTSNSSSGLSGMTSLFSDYNSIRNGSYGKLMKSYYGMNTSGVSGTTGTNNTTKKSSTDTLSKLLEEKKNPTVSKEVSKANAALSQGMSSVKSSVAALQDEKTYEDTAGGKTAQTKVTDALKSFVSDYNDTITAAKKSTTTNLTANAGAMMRTTNSNADKLAEIGITKNSDGTLSLNEKKLQGADLSKVKQLFSSDDKLNYGSTIASRARGTGYFSTDTSTGAAAKTTDAQTVQETTSSAQALKTDAQSLASKDLYAKVKDANGNETDKYDVDSITAKAKSFVSNYNDTVDSAKYAKNSGVTSNLSYMQSKTKANASSLEEFGITVDKNGKMAIDEEKFKNADMSKVESVFKNYGSSVATNASLINYYAKTQANAASGYNPNGAYNTTAQSSYVDAV